MEWDDDEELFLKENIDARRWGAEEERRDLLLQIGGGCQRSHHGAVDPRTTAPHQDNTGPPQSREPHQRRPHHLRDSSSQDDRRPATRTLFVYNIPPTFYELELQEMFEKYGSVIRTSAPYKNDISVTKKYGFVEFEREQDATRARTALHGALVGGHRIKVEWSTSARNKNDKERMCTGGDSDEPSDRKRNYRRLQREDEDKFMHLIEMYTLLMAQPSPENKRLPELDTFLGCVNIERHSLVPAWVESEHNVSIDLAAIKQSFVDSLTDSDDVNP